MKKIVLALLAMGLATGMLAGCGSSPTSSTPSLSSEGDSQIVSSEGSQVSGPESAVSETSPSSTVSTVSSSVSSKASSSVSSKASSSVSSKASSSAASKPASSTPSSSGSSTSKPPVQTVTPQQICKAIAQAYDGDYYPDGEMPEELIYGQFAVDRSLVQAAYGEMSMISVNPDQVIVMKAVDGKGAQLETALQAQRDKYVAEAMVYPKDTAKLNASRVVRSGDYVAFIMLGAVDEVHDDISSAEAQKFAQDQIAIGVRAFQNAVK